MDLNTLQQDNTHPLKSTALSIINSRNAFLSPSLSSFISFQSPLKIICHFQSQKAFQKQCVTYLFCAYLGQTSPHQTTLHSLLLVLCLFFRFCDQFLLRHCRHRSERIRGRLKFGIEKSICYGQTSQNGCFFQKSDNFCKSIARPGIEAKLSDGATSVSSKTKMSSTTARKHFHTTFDHSSNICLHTFLKNEKSYIACFFLVTIFSLWSIAYPVSQNQPQMQTKECYT